MASRISNRVLAEELVIRLNEALKTRGMSLILTAILNTKIYIPAANPARNLIATDEDGHVGFLGILQQLVSGYTIVAHCKDDDTEEVLSFSVLDG